MSPLWTVFLAVSVAVNVIMGYREARRMIWKTKKKYGTKTYSTSRVGGRQRRSPSSRTRQPR